MPTAVFSFAKINYPLNSIASAITQLANYCKVAVVMSRQNRIERKDNRRRIMIFVNGEGVITVV